MNGFRVLAFENHNVHANVSQVKCIINKTVEQSMYSKWIVT